MQQIVMSVVATVLSFQAAETTLDADMAETTTQAETVVLETPEIDIASVLDRANQSLNATETAKGRFLQIAADGYVSQGEFALRRPGRVRFEYDDPDPLTIVADGTTVAVADRDLETVDRVPLSSTPLALMLRRDTNLAEDAEILDVRKEAGYVRIEMQDKSGEAEGNLVLIFDEADYALVQWVVIDPQGGVTQIRLSNVETNVRLNGRLFRLDDMEDDDDRRR